jgi:hypothetical protein
MANAMTSSTLEVAVQAWQRLWRTGGNGDETKTKNKTTHKNKNNKNTTNKTQKKIPRRNKRETLKAYQQRSISGENLDLCDVEEFGDPFHDKQDNTLRIGLHNLSNLTKDKRTSKSHQLVDYIVQKSFDIFLMTEVGLCWKKVDPANQWYERILGKFWWTRLAFANNVTELNRSKVLLPDGVGILATDEVAHRVVAQGKDPTGLGTWTWVRLQGRNGTCIRIITAYRPCDSPGPETVNQQHLWYT